MSKVLITNNNIQLLKSNLKNTHPTLKSSILSEAIARSLGFGTHAALICYTKKPKTELELRSFNEQFFYDWLKSKGNILTTSISSQCFEELDLPIYKYIIGSHNKKIALSNAWFEKCQDFNIPYIWLDQKTKYTSVNWDYISVDEHHNPNKFTDDDATKIRSLIDKYSNKKTRVLPSSLFVGTITGLDKDSAKLIASEIFCILYSLKDW